MTLDELQKGGIGCIIDIDGDETLRRKLLNLEIALDTDVQFLRKAPLRIPDWRQYDRHTQRYCQENSNSAEILDSQSKV